MPGGRLSPEDRQDIAAGLTDGLSYAEIAKRLGRPASTITREVARNGGAHGYRPNRAQQATVDRARRGKSRPTTAAPSIVGTPGRDPETVRAFEDELTTVLVLTGFSRMTARVLACLYTTDTGSLTAAELVQRLQVSPASISTAIGTLEEQELVTRQRDPRQRRDRYVIDDDVWYRAMLASARSNAMLADTVRRGSEILGTVTPAGLRLQDVGHFLERVYEELVRAAEHWRQVHTKDPDHERLANLS
nr:MarR family transcriptional regulator [Kibdelosporangium sp. MJ126-NF4]CEL17415.1 hypothetical protein [Kibdelosporangium sp. MJ126-NF4]CTQ91358.1 hypothetical protein [Kibdelosporangium sp. MJ126-NF4]